MFIIPFICKSTVHNNIIINNIKILTIGGKYLWEEDDNLHIDTDILEPNGIYRASSTIKSIPAHPTYYLCEVDSNKTSLNEFYKWEELLTDDDATFCWKTYTHLTDTNKNTWLPSPLSEKLNSVPVSEIISTIYAS
jgi:hypothetical protein